MYNRGSSIYYVRTGEWGLLDLGDFAYEFVGEA